MLHFYSITPLIDTHFNNSTILLMLLAALLLIGGIVYYACGKTKLSVAFVVAGGLTLRLMMCFTDPFLHAWDEQVHALVALNLSKHWLHPTLYETAFHNSSAQDWTSSQLWLHKPPLFLWQMALSIKLFGNTYWAVRIPSALLSALTIVCVYRIARLLSNERTAFVAALLLAVSNIHLHVVSGRLNTDHNDVVFMCCVTFSVWAFVEYYARNKFRYVMLIGLFAGMAILTKWMAGLLIFGIWFIALVADSERRYQQGEWRNYIAGLAICSLVALPWFIYAGYRWPEHFAAFLESNKEHVFTAIPNHEGDYLYHFREMYAQYKWFSLFFIAGLFLLLKRSNYPPVAKGLAVGVAVVFIVFSAVATKMPLFAHIISGLLLLFAAQGISFLFPFLFSKKILLIPFLLFLCISLFNIDKLEREHSHRNPHDLYWKTRTYNRLQYAKVHETLAGKNYVLFNCGSFNYISYMYYHQQPAYSYLPTPDQLCQIEKAGMNVAVLDDHQLPEDILKNDRIIKVDVPLMRNDF